MCPDSWRAAESKFTLISSVERIFSHQLPLFFPRGVIATENKNQNVLTSGLSNKERVPMFSYWAYILVGANDTGKTPFQRSVVRHLCYVRYDRLPITVVNEVNHPRAPKA